MSCREPVCPLSLPVEKTGASSGIDQFHYGVAKLIESKRHGRRGHKASLRGERQPVTRLGSYGQVAEHYRTLHPKKRVFGEMNG